MLFINNNSLYFIFFVCDDLGQAETGGAFADGHQEHVPQLLVVLIGWQVELVEAGVRARQARRVTIVSVYLKLLRAVHALKFGEALQWHLARTRHELQELGEILLVEGLERTPEPLGLQRAGRVLVVLGVVAQVLEVDLGQAWDEQLELLLVEDRDQALGYDLVEAAEEGGHLLTYAADHLLLADQAHVLLLVLVGDMQVAAVGLQVATLHHAKLVDVDAEVELDAEALDVRLEDGDEVLVELVVHRLHVRVAHRHAEYVLVEGSCEVTV